MHSYGDGTVDAAARAAAELGLRAHAFPPSASRLLRADLVYLVRPDGFVAAKALAPVAAAAFRRVLPEGYAFGR